MAIIQKVNDLNKEVDQLKNEVAHFIEDNNIDLLDRLEVFLNIPNYLLDHKKYLSCIDHLPTTRKYFDDNRNSYGRYKTINFKSFLEEFVSLLSEIKLLNLSYDLPKEEYIKSKFENSFSYDDFYIPFKKMAEEILSNHIGSVTLDW